MYGVIVVTAKKLLLKDFICFYKLFRDHPVHCTHFSCPLHCRQPVTLLVPPFRNVPGPVAARPAPRLRRADERRVRRRHALPRPARQHARLGELPQPDGGGDQQGAGAGGGGGGRRRRQRGGGRDEGRLRAEDEERPHPAQEEVAGRALRHEVVRPGPSVCLSVFVATCCISARCVYLWVDLRAVKATACSTGWLRGILHRTLGPLQALLPPGVSALQQPWQSVCYSLHPFAKNVFVLPSISQVWPGTISRNLADVLFAHPCSNTTTRGHPPLNHASLFTGPQTEEAAEHRRPRPEGHDRHPVDRQHHLLDEHRVRLHGRGRLHDVGGVQRELHDGGRIYTSRGTD